MLMTPYLRHALENLVEHPNYVQSSFTLSPRATLTLPLTQETIETPSHHRTVQLEPQQLSACDWVLKL